MKHVRKIGRKGKKERKERTGTWEDERMEVWKYARVNGERGIERIEREGRRGREKRRGGEEGRRGYSPLSRSARILSTKLITQIVMQSRHIEVM